MNRSLAASALAGLLAFVMGIFLMTPVANAKAQELTTVSNIAIESSSRSTIAPFMSLEVLPDLPAKQKAKPVVIKDVKVLNERKAAKAKAAKKASERLVRKNTTYKAKTNKVSTKTVTRSKSSTTRAPSATRGAVSSRNWGTAGQCTWGALNKWKQSEGYYPAWRGNAETWGYRAANAGYRVSSVPRTRAILVMQAGVHGSSSVGHVAWVTRVSGNKVTIIEMNALAGAFNYNTRTLTHKGGMQYVYAP